MKKASLVVCSILTFGCDGLNSSFGKNKGSSVITNKPPVSEKPVACTFDFSNTCWEESAMEIMSCLDTTSEEEKSQEIFNDTKEFCKNSGDKTILFENPQQMFALPVDVNNTPFDFRVFPDGKHECLRVQGNPQKFKIQLANSKRSMDFDFTTNTLKFTCMDGQSVQVPYEVFQGCAQSLGETFVSTVPGMQVKMLSNGGKSLWSLRLRGAPQAPDFFKCIEP